MPELRPVEGYQGLYRHIKDKPCIDDRLVVICTNPTYDEMFITKLMSPGDCVNKVPEKYHPSEEHPLRFFINYHSHHPYCCGTILWNTIVSAKQDSEDLSDLEVFGQVTGDPDFFIPEDIKNQFYPEWTKRNDQQVDDEAIFDLVRRREFLFPLHEGCRLELEGSRTVVYSVDEKLLIEATFPCGYGPVMDERVEDVKAVYALAADIDPHDFPLVQEGPLEDAHEKWKQGKAMLHCIRSMGTGLDVKFD